MTEYIVDVKEMIEKLGYEVPMVLDKNGKMRLMTDVVIPVNMVPFVLKLLDNYYNMDGYVDALEWLHQMAWEEGSEEARAWLLKNGFRDEEYPD